MEIMWDSYAWLRIGNIIVAMLAMAGMGVSFAVRRKRTPRRYRRLAASLYFVLAAIAYGSGRAASLGAPVAEHIMLLFASLSCLAVALFWSPVGDDQLPGPNDPALPARALRAARFYWHRWRHVT